MKTIYSQATFPLSESKFSLNFAWAEMTWVDSQCGPSELRQLFNTFRLKWTKLPITLFNSEGILNEHNLYKSQMTW